MAERLFKSVAVTDPERTAGEMEQMTQAVDSLEKDYIEDVIRLTEQYEKPVLGVSLLTDDRTRTLYRQDGCRYKGVFFPSPERAVKALAGMWRYQKWRSSGLDS